MLYACDSGTDDARSQVDVPKLLGTAMIRKVDD